MPFEFDAHKSASNKLKHGIDFVEAQALWRSKTIEAPAKTAEEQRYLVLGTIGGDHWTAIISYRGMTCRIISVRKSTPKEADFYAKNIR